MHNKLKCYYCTAAKEGEFLFTESTLGVKHPACDHCFMEIIDKCYVGCVGDEIIEEVE